MQSYAYSSKLCVLLEPHSSFQFQYQLLTMTTFFEIAVYRWSISGVSEA